MATCDVIVSCIIIATHTLGDDDDEVGVVVGIRVQFRTPPCYIGGAR